MKIKPIYLVVLMLLFMALVFLDQNQDPVPIKILLGGPFHFGLSVIILLSVIAGMLLTIGAKYLMKKRKALNGKKHI